MANGYKEMKQREKGASWDYSPAVDGYSCIGWAQCHVSHPELWALQKRKLFLSLISKAEGVYVSKTQSGSWFHTLFKNNSKVSHNNVAYQNNATWNKYIAKQSIPDALRNNLSLNRNK